MKFDVGESLILTETGEKVTVIGRSWMPKRAEPTYYVKEVPGFFIYESDLERPEDRREEA